MGVARIGNKRCWVYKNFDQAGDYTLEISNTKVADAEYFDSIDEAEYYIYLERNGIIFTRQNKYELIPNFNYMGEFVRGITYKDDFRIGNFILDIKGMETDTYKIKAKMMKQYCARESKDGATLKYIAIYDLANHLKYVYDLLPVRYLDIRIVHKIKACTKKVEKGKGVNDRRKQAVIDFFKELPKEEMVINKELNIAYFI